MAAAIASIGRVMACEGDPFELLRGRTICGRCAFRSAMIVSTSASAIAKSFIVSFNKPIISSNASIKAQHEARDEREAAIAFEHRVGCR